MNFIKKEIISFLFQSNTLISSAFILFLSFSLIAQKKNENLLSSYRISDCEGAISLDKVGDYSVSFTADEGKFFDLDKQNVFGLKPEANSIWFKYKAVYSSQVSLSLLVPTEDISFAVFTSSTNACRDALVDKSSLIYQAELSKGEVVMKGEDHGFLNVSKGQTVFFYFNTGALITDELGFKFDVKADDFTKTVKDLMELTDIRRDVLAPTYQVSVRDASTKLPVSSKIIISGSKQFDALYTGSDIRLNLDRGVKYDIKIDAVGYFPKDTSIRITEITKNMENVFFMTPVVKGKKVKLEGIGFLPKSDVFRDDAADKLQRLRDFMVLNPSVRIEVQGHVHRLGANNGAAKRLSKKRAKRVVKFLVNAGVDKSRMQFVGFGNAQMLYPEPKSNAEEQANRRVEIEILTVDE